jgi:hypothetical protein
MPEFPVLLAQTHWQDWEFWQNLKEALIKSLEILREL